MAQGKAFTEEQKQTIIESLRTYLEMGFSRNKSCAFIGLDATTLCKWVKEDEALSMKLEGWENAINKLVMANLVDAIKKEGELVDDTRKETTKWWAERKMKQDFSTRIENTGADGKDLPIPILGVVTEPSILEQVDNVQTNNSTEENQSTDEED